MVAVASLDLERGVLVCWDCRSTQVEAGAMFCVSCELHRQDQHEAVLEDAVLRGVVRKAWCHGAGPDGTARQLLTQEPAQVFVGGV